METPGNLVLSTELLIPNNVKQIIIISSAAVVCLIIFSPAFVPFLWHIAYGNAVECSGKRVPVPRLWYAHVRNGTVYLSKISKTVFVSFPASSFVGPIPGRKRTTTSQEETYSALERLYSKMQGSNEFTVTGPIRQTSGANQIDCFKSVSARYDGWVIVDCVFFEGTWKAHFVGTEKESANFFQLLNGISPIENAPK